MTRAELTDLERRIAKLERIVKLLNQFYNTTHFTDMERVRRKIQEEVECESFSLTP